MNSSQDTAKSFRLWAIGDVHVGSDLRKGRESLAEALRQSEQRDSHPFEWDVAINVGDYSGGQTVPDDDEGREVVRQFSVLEQHRREQIYDVCGKHDRSGLLGVCRPSLSVNSLSS